MLNFDSSKEQKRNAAEAVYELLSDYLFDKVNLLNSPDNANSTATTNTSFYRTGYRIPDTARGKHLRLDRKMRVRIIFFISGGVENADFYVLCPVANPSESSLSSDISSLAQFTEYAGIRCNNGALSLSSKSSSDKATSFRLTSQTTYKLDLIYNITYTDVWLDNVYVGSIDCDFSSAIANQVVMYPLFAPIRSTTGVSVNFNSENYQILQDK